MTLSRHTLALGAGASPDDAPLGVISGTVTINERRAPYVEASFLLAYPADPDTLELINVRGGGLKALARVEYRDPVTAGKVTTWTGAAPVRAADITALLGNAPLSTVTAALSTWHNSVERDAAELPLTLTITDVVPDIDAGEIRVTATGYESRLMDYKYFGAGYTAAAGQSVRQTVYAVLQTVNFNFRLEAGGPDGATPQPMSWMGGVSAWDFLDAVLQPVGLTLQYTPEGTWRLITANAPPAVSKTLDRVTRLNRTESRDEWGDAVLVAYSWTDPVGGAQVRADIATFGPTPQKVIVVEHKDVPYPGPGAAAVILDRARTLSRHIEVEAVSDLSIRPGVELIAAPPGRTSETGRATAVSFAWPENQMTVTTTR